MVNKSGIRGFEATQYSEWQDMFLPNKMAEFSNELVTKDDIKLQELRILATELDSKLTCCNVYVMYIYVVCLMKLKVLCL